MSEFDKDVSNLVAYFEAKMQPTFRLSHIHRAIDTDKYFSEISPELRAAVIEKMSWRIRG